MNIQHLTWFFRPANGYKHSCAVAYYHHIPSGELRHFGHVNAYSDTDYTEENSLSYYPTLKSDEDNGMLGPEGRFESLQEAIDCLNYFYTNDEWPAAYWKSAMI